jgi:transposase
MWRPWCEETHTNDEAESSAENCLQIKSQLGIQAKNIVLNVYTNLKNENKEMCNKHIMRRTSQLTEVNYCTVYNIVIHGVQERKTRTDKGNRKIKSWDLDIIRRTLYNLYKENHVATIDTLYNKLVENTDVMCSRSTLWRTLTEHGFKYQTINKRLNIMESDRIRKLRYEYLAMIKKFRNEGRFICYLDETWYDTHDTIKKGWIEDKNKCQLNVPHYRGKRIIILHAGSENGWIGQVLLSAKNIKKCSLDYHEDMSSNLFEEWFKNKLLPVLPEKSVIVMDNASYHSRQIIKVPTSSSSKNEIKLFLEENDLFYEETYSKQELLEVLRTKKFEKQYYVDHMAMVHGHSVLRLPPYHCILNPI